MASLSKEEYLKKYISGETADEKRKKKRKKVKANNTKPRGLKIVDDDVDFNSLLPSNLENTLEEDIGDNEPTVAEFVDERPDHIKRLEQYRKDDRWKVLTNSKKTRHDSDSDDSNSFQISGSHNLPDQSPVEKQRHDSDSDQSPLRKQRHDSDSDQSPPRKQRHDSDSDQSPPRKQRHDSESDQSPPRKQRHDSESDQSPPRKQRPDSESDQSPPRRQNQQSDSDQSPPRKKRHNSGSDQSPPRRKKHGSDSDQSPPRKRRQDSKQDNIKIEDSHSNKPANRKSRWNAESPTDKSKIGISNHGNGSEEIRKDEQGRSKKTLGGATAGLSSAKQMRHEANMMRQREEDMYSKLDDEALGKNARTLRRKRKDDEEDQKKAEEETKKAELQLKYKAWNKGLKQAELEQAAVVSAMHEMSKPLTRHRDDADLDKELRTVDREGDPMLAFIKKKTKPGSANKKELPRYKGSEPPPNRFKLWPGYRWDGVDRSNGFEKQIYAKMAEKRAVKEIAYKWSVEDM